MTTPQLLLAEKNMLSILSILRQKLDINDFLCFTGSSIQTDGTSVRGR